MSWVSPAGQKARPGRSRVLEPRAARRHGNRERAWRAQDGLSWAGRPTFSCWTEQVLDILILTSTHPDLHTPTHLGNSSLGPSLPPRGRWGPEEPHSLGKLPLKGVKGQMVAGAKGWLPVWRGGRRV